MNINAVHIAKLSSCVACLRAEYLLLIVRIAPWSLFGSGMAIAKPLSTPFVETVMEIADVITRARADFP